jgi:hypothetical protein
LRALRDVGPRSAHIAGLGYACFTPLETLEGARVVSAGAQPGDTAGYLALESRGGERFALTPTCAANLLGYVGENDFARGNRDSAARGFAIAGEALGLDGEVLARAVLEKASDKLRATIDELIADYDLARDEVELVGGGGGAAALVPFAAERLGLRHRIARDAEVISPLGVALALVRDVVERTIVAPTPDDVVRVRREAFERVVVAGASPAFVEVTVEIDARLNLVRATASGATAAVAGASAVALASDEERRSAAARSLRSTPAALERAPGAGAFAIFETRGASATPRDLCAVDERGVVRFVARRAHVRTTTVAALERDLADLLDEATAFGDVGRALPDVHLVYAARVAGIGTLAEPAQVVALAAEEVRGLDHSAAILLVAESRA